DSGRASSSRAVPQTPGTSSARSSSRNASPHSASHIAHSSRSVATTDASGRPSCLKPSATPSRRWAAPSDRRPPFAVEEPRMAEPEPKPERYTGETLAAWSLPAAASAEIGIGVEWPERVTRDWALGGSTGAGIRVCILDSGIQPDHRLVGEVEGAVALRKNDEGEIVVEEDTEGDLAGHGTACAGIVRALAPDCRLFSVRVLGAGFKGSGAVLLEGLRWAIGQGFDVINMSLSTTKKQFSGLLHELADSAYFRRTVLVASAHNMPVESYPWRFSSVISVGSHEEHDPLTFFYNPSPPVEFFAR